MVSCPSWTQEEEEKREERGRERPHLNFGPLAPTTEFGRRLPLLMDVYTMKPATDKEESGCRMKIPAAEERERCQWVGSRGC